MRDLKKARKFQMNLHLFGYDGDGAGTGAGEGDGAGGTGGQAGNAGGDAKQDPPQKTFDEILTEGTYQADFDRRVQKALGTAREKWEALMDDKLSEADKLAKMTKEEKAQYLAKKHEKELTDREAAITRRELMAEAKNTLTEKNLPMELAELLNYADADACNKSIEAAEKAFQKAVQAAVEDKLKGGTPPKKAPAAEDDALAKQVEQLMMGTI